MSVPSGWSSSPVEVVPADCPRCLLQRDQHQAPAVDDPTQIPSQVRCPHCCLATFRTET